MADFDIPELQDELKALRRGYGVEAGNIKIGRVLRWICGITEQDGPHARREKVRTRLNELIGELPVSLREIATQALGLGGAGDLRYDDRVAALAARVKRDQRTVKRRVDLTLQRMTESAREGGPPPGPVRSMVPWHTSHLLVRVRFGQAGTEVLKTRRITSHQSGLTEVEHTETVDPVPGRNVSVDPVRLGVTVTGGGTLHSPRLLARNRVGYRLRLPRPLERDEQHEYSCRIRMADEFAPYYVCTSEVPCDRFELVIRFAAGRIPERIWLLEREFPLALNDVRPDRKSLTANAEGEVEVEFDGLDTNRSYGIGWSLPPE